jgi:hypothetical protein
VKSLDTPNQKYACTKLSIGAYVVATSTASSPENLLIRCSATRPCAVSLSPDSSSIRSQRNCRITVTVSIRIYGLEFVGFSERTLLPCEGLRREGREYSGKIRNGCEVSASSPASTLDGVRYLWHAQWCRRQSDIRPATEQAPQV